MSTHSVNLELLTAEFPRDREAASRLVHHFTELAKRDGGRDKVYSVGKMFDIASPSSKDTLLRLLSRLVQQGLIDQFIRLEVNATGQGDFASISDVPDEIVDRNTGETIEVRPDYVRLYYKLHA